MTLFGGGDNFDIFLNFAQNMLVMFTPAIQFDYIKVGLKCVLIS